MDKSANNCWDYFGCPEEDRKRCPAYIIDGKEKCWWVASKNTEICNSGVKITDGMKECWSCDWFKKNNPEFI